MKYGLLFLILAFSTQVFSGERDGPCTSGAKQKHKDDLKHYIKNEALIHCGSAAPYRFSVDPNTVGQGESLEGKIKEQLDAFHQESCVPLRELLKEKDVIEFDDLSTDLKDRVRNEAVWNYVNNVYGCNRRKDTKWAAINRRIKKLGEMAKGYPSNLRERKVKGNIKYMGFFPLPYGYILRRDSGIWTLKAALLFDFIQVGWKKDYIDMPEDLARKLGVWDGPCDNTVKEKVGVLKKEEIVAGKFEARYGNVCRMKIEQMIEHPKTLTQRRARDWIKYYYKEVIESFWSRPNFKVEVTILNKRSDGWPEFRNAIWKIDFALKPDKGSPYHKGLGSRGAAMGVAILTGGVPSATAIAAIVGDAAYKNMYIGYPPHVIAHEFGHWLGLDDEYAGPGESYSCADNPNMMASKNMMCGQYRTRWPVCMSGDEVHKGIECRPDLQYAISLKRGLNAGDVTEEEILAYRAVMINKFATNQDERELMQQVDYNQLGQAGVYYFILQRRYMLGKSQIGHYKNKDGPPKIPLDYCSKKYKPPFDEDQSNKICKAAHGALCGINIPEQRDATCSLFKKLPKGDELFNKCGACSGAGNYDGEYVIPEDNGDGIIDFSELDPSAYGIDDNEGQADYTDPTSDSLNGELVLPDDYEYPEPD